MKKILSIILSTAILLSVFCGISIETIAATPDASGTCGSNLTWSYYASNGLIQIAPINSNEEGWMDNYSTSNAPWAAYKSNIKSVVFEEGSDRVGSNAFYGYSAITSVTFPNDFDTIGYAAFSNCTALKSVILPASAEWLYSAAFQGCTNLKYASVPARNGGQLPDYFFQGCTLLSVVVLGSGITAINQYAFADCTKLSMIQIEASSAPSVGTNALKNVPSSVTVVGTASSGAQAFASARGYTYSADSFSGSCGTSLNYSFDWVSGKLTITGSGEMTDYANVSAPWMKFGTLLTSVDFSQTNGSSISSKAFYQCTSITSIDLNGVSAIGWYAFNGCTSLKSVTIADSVTKVWSGCFQDCTGIEWVNFGSGLTELTPYMFAGCNNSSFWWVHIPANITTITYNAFYNCSSLSWNTIAGENVVFENACFDGINSSATFLGIDQSTRDFVTSHNSSAKTNWSFSCIDHKSFTQSAVAPTCEAEGYTLYSCTVCSYNYKTNYVGKTGHIYQKTGTSGDYYYLYSCRTCSKQNITLSAADLKYSFYPSVTKNASILANGNPCDVNGDGFINIRDFRLINRMINNTTARNRLTTLDKSTVYQTMEGFGASSCWWSNYLGNWENAEDIIKLLYDEEDGIGLNVYRYNLGAGSENDSNLYDVDRRSQNFLSADGTSYDWTKDVSPRKCLEIANNLNPNLRVTLFANSPPVQYTTNGKAYGSYTTNTTYTTNLPSSNYSKYATYAIKVGEHFTDEGYNVVDISPINEPQYSWIAYGETSAGQEGCYYTPAQARDVYKEFIKQIKTSPINSTCKISMFESGAYEGSGTTFSSYVDTMLKSSDSATLELRNYFDTITGHSYWSSKSTREAAATYLKNNYGSYKLKATEYCQMTNDGNSGVYDLIQSVGGSTNGMTIDYGLAMANIIMQDLTILNVIEWDWWVGVAPGVYPDGLVYINKNNPSDVQTAKRLWCLGNFSKFTEEGSVRIKTTQGTSLTNAGVSSVAFKNPDGTMSIVYINTSNNAEATYFDDSQYKKFTTYVTDATHDLEEYQTGKVGTFDGAVLPARSVTTVVLSAK